MTEPTPTKEENLDNVKLMSEFEHDWGGYGEPPFSPENIELFRETIENLDTQPIISPTGACSLYMGFACNGRIFAANLRCGKMETVYMGTVYATIRQIKMVGLPEIISEEYKITNGKEAAQILNKKLKELNFAEDN